MVLKINSSKHHHDSLTVARTADKAGSHANVLMPLDRVKTNISGDEWRTEVMIASVVAIRISSKFLQHQQQQFTDE